MPNNYIISKMDKNCIYVRLKFDLPFHDKNADIMAKIDTGCMYSTIAVKRLNWKTLDVDFLKQEAVKAVGKGVGAKLSFGVNDSEDYKQIERLYFHSKEYDKCTAINFYHYVQNVYIDAYNIHINNLRFNYDRPTSVLIGMDILQMLDIHIGASLVEDTENDIKKEDTIFIGCQKDNITPEYLEALERYFGYTTVLIS